MDILWGFPGGSAGKESTCNVGDLGSMPGLGRFTGEGNSYPLQYSGLENSMDCIPWGRTESDMSERLSLSLSPWQDTSTHWDSVSTRQNKPVLSSFSSEVGLLPTSHVYMCLISWWQKCRNTPEFWKMGMRVINSIRDRTHGKKIEYCEPKHSIF